MTLPDGTITKPLEYVGHAVSDEKQDNTLMPWAQVHTADNHNNWAGAYGRLGWDGYSPTVITRCEPAATQGMVLHPSEDRIITVREDARLQGFPDDLVLCGSLMDKTRLIGNAVPFALGDALGKSILRSMIGG